MNDYGQYRYKYPNSYQNQRRTFHNQGGGNQQYPYNSFNLSPTLVLVYALCGLAIIYNLLQQPLQLPPLWLLPFYPFRRMLGQRAQGKIENLFGGGGLGLLRGPGRIFGGIGAGSPPFGAGDEWEGWIGGLYNTGNTCYQNCVLQAMASLQFLPGHLASIVTSSSDDDVVAAKLREIDGTPAWASASPSTFSSSSPAAELDILSKMLNTKSRYPRAFTPPGPLRLNPSSNSWFHEQQDAQEFFQKLTAELEKEAVAAWKKRNASAKNGLKDISNDQGSERGELVLSQTLSEDLKSPFEGLLAQRVGCLRCGYVEAIRMQGFTSLSLALPSSWSCRLGECLQEFTTLETLNGVPCERCTLLATKSRLEKILETQPPPQNSADATTTTTSSNMSSQLTPELREVLGSRLTKIDEALEESDFSTERLKECNIPRKNIMESDKTKQIMIARPPLVLVLHMNRSVFDLTTGGTRKNYAAVEFTPVIDLEPWIVGNSSGFGLDPSRPMRVTGKEKSRQSTKYRLQSVVAHFGSHGSGHYICYRRTYPSKANNADAEKGNAPEAVERRKATWWRCSDCDVRPADEEEVLAVGNAFMLYYERMSPEEAEQSSHLFKAAQDTANAMDAQGDDGEVSVGDGVHGSNSPTSSKSSSRRSSMSDASSSGTEDGGENTEDLQNDTECSSESATSDDTVVTTPSMNDASPVLNDRPTASAPSLSSKNILTLRKVEPQTQIPMPIQSTLEPISMGSS